MTPFTTYATQPTADTLAEELSFVGGMTVDEAAEHAIAIYKEAREREKDDAEAWRQVQAAAKQVLSDILTELQTDKLKARSGLAYVPAPSLVVSYDAAALDALAASDEGLRRILEPHRRVSQRPGSLTIR